MSEQLTNFGRTQLDGTINDSVTTVSVIAGSVFPATGNFRVNVQDELMLCTSRSGNDLTVVRGQEGTLAASHDDQSYITQVATAGSIVQLIDDRTVTSKLYAFENFK